MVNLIHNVSQKNKRVLSFFYFSWFFCVLVFGYVVIKIMFHYFTTVHKDITERLLKIDTSLANKARKVLEINKSERHIRGGMATRKKYLGKKWFFKYFG